jgi:hypothetical protein
VINNKVLDISKRNYSILQLQPQDDWQGQVIVKSNLNYFGIPERKDLPYSLMRELREQLAKRSWRYARTLPHKTYPVLNSIKFVPGWVWRDDDLIVEKFMPEREGDLYCLRGWIFLGSKSYGYRLFATDPLVKTESMVRYEINDEVPEDLIPFRKKMGFDYGKFDYVVHDGQTILLDANKTPTYRGPSDSPRIRLIAEGINDFLM